MARPSKYNWEAIKESYEGGLPVHDISDKFHIEVKKINEKAKLKKWVIKDRLKTDIQEFETSFKTVVQNSFEHKETEEIFNKIVVEKIDTILEDNKLIGNNRKLASMAQGILLSNKENFNHTNIRNLTGAIKDIESVANPPKPNQVNVQQNTNVAVLTPEQKREMFKQRKKELLQ